MNWRIDKHGEPEIGQFLTELAVTGEVTAGTQNQALAALMFYYGKVLGKDVKTTMIYTHVMNRPGLAVTSPLDRIMESAASA